MRHAALFVGLLAAGCAGGGGGGGSRPSPEGGSASEGQRLYLAGRFDDALASLERAVAADPKDVLALRLLGRIHMLHNRLDKAASRLDAAVRAEKYPDPGALEDLALTFYRQDNYAQAANVFSYMGDGVLAKKYGDMAKVRPPYTATWRDDVSTVRFFATNPQPLVQMRVNGTGGLFAIDTGSGEIVLDRAFARGASARIVATRASAAADVSEEAYVDTVDLPSLSVRNVPVAIRDLKSSSDRQIDGVIGSGFLSHFNTTLDYKREQLVLRRRGRGEAARGQEMPLYFAGDRYFLVPAMLDGVATFAMVRTGAVRTAFAPSPGYLGTRGQVKEARVGPLSPAIHAPTESFPAGLDYSFGFLIGGLVGAEALKGRAVTFDMDRMRLVVE